MNGHTFIQPRPFFYAAAQFSTKNPLPAFGGVGPESIPCFQVTGGRIYVIDLWVEVLVATVGPGVNGQFDVTFPVGGLPPPGTFALTAATPVDALPPGTFLTVDLPPGSPLLNTGLPGTSVTVGIPRKIVEPCTKSFSVDGALTGQMRAGLVWTPLDPLANVIVL